MERGLYHSNLFEQIENSGVTSSVSPDKSLLDKIFNELRDVKPHKLSIKVYEYGYETQFQYSKFRYTPSGVALVKRALCKSKLEIAYWGLLLRPLANRKRLVIKAGKKTFIGYDTLRDVGVHAYLNQELFFKAAGMTDYNGALLLIETVDGTWYLLFELPKGKIQVFDSELAIVICLFEDKNTAKIILSDKFKHVHSRNIIERFLRQISKGLCYSRICKSDILISSSTDSVLVLDFMSYSFHGLDKKRNIIYLLGKLAAEGVVNIDDLKGSEFNGIQIDSSVVEAAKKSKLVCTQILLERVSRSNNNISNKDNVYSSAS